jgi:acetylornithine deacetylase/succinyl-diaminopimelate desuccinylase-like protein
VIRKAQVAHRNGVLQVPPSAAAKSLSVDCHLDTVAAMENIALAMTRASAGVSLKTSPPEARVAATKVHGRGFCDTEATVAALLAALIDLHCRGMAKRHRFIVVGGTVGEWPATGLGVMTRHRLP